MSNFGERKLSRKNDRVIINCCIHGVIELDPVAVRIINTLEFQRLRDIHQMGCSPFVYPTGTNTRFDHSIGTYHLARKWIESLGNECKDLINQKDAICVKLAGLCHDLGHGPFSHFWDEYFLRRLKIQLPGDVKPHHENRSADIFQMILDEVNGKNGVKQMLTEDYGFEEIDFRLIEAIIEGDKSERKIEEDEEMQRRIGNKWIILEIVSNSRNGFDVDKMDYLKRDSHFLGIKGDVVDVERLIYKFHPKQDANGKWILCPDKLESLNILSIFELRYRLHRIAYQHKTRIGIEEQLYDAFRLADPILKLSSKTLKDFWKLTDSVMWEIHRSEDPRLKDAQEMIRRILTRDLYKPVAYSLFHGECEEDSRVLDKSNEDLAQDIYDVIRERKYLDEETLEEIKANRDICVAKCKFAFNSKSGHPLLRQVVVTPTETRQFGPSELPKVLQRFSYEEHEFRVYWRNPSTKSVEVFKAIFKGFATWCDQHKFSPPEMYKLPE